MWPRARSCSCRCREELGATVPSPSPAPGMSRPSCLSEPRLERGSPRRRFQRLGVCVRERSLFHPQHPECLAHALRQDERLEQMRAAKTLRFGLAIREYIRKLIRLPYRHQKPGLRFEAREPQAASVACFHKLREIHMGGEVLVARMREQILNHL